MKSKFIYLTGLMAERGYVVDYDDSLFGRTHVLYVDIIVEENSYSFLDSYFNSWRDAYYWLLGVYHTTFKF